MKKSNKNNVALTGKNIKAKISKIRQRRAELGKKICDLQMEIISLMDICPHESSHLNRACDVDTAVCDDCGKEIPVLVSGRFGKEKSFW